MRDEIQVVEHGATHHIDQFHTWIDVIFTDDNEVVLDANNMFATFPCKHNIIDVTIDTQISKPLPNLTSFSYRDFKSIKQEELLHLLDACHWSSISCPDMDVDSKFELLSSNIMAAKKERFSAMCRC